MFDPDRSNTITKKEMEDAFKQSGIKVANDTIDYVFKMADVSGEGQITFDEWRSLFENIIKDAIRYMIMGVFEIIKNQFFHKKAYI